MVLVKVIPVSYDTLRKNNIKANNTSPFDRKLDIIDVNRSINTKSISGKIYNILIELGFDKDFNAHEKKK